MTDTLLYDKFHLPDGLSVHQSCLICSLVKLLLSVSVWLMVLSVYNEIQHFKFLSVFIWFLLAVILRVTLHGIFSFTPIAVISTTVFLLLQQP